MTLTHDLRRTTQRAPRRTVLLAVTALAVGLGTLPAQSAPQDPWDYEKYDCLNDRWNPLDADGNRTGASPEPGTAEWAAFNDSHVACTDQRDSDRNQHLFADSPRSAAMYGADPYRNPDYHDGVRFHYDDFTIAEIPSVPSAEAYRPCTTAPGDCPGLPKALERFDGPRPVVVVMHGFTADKSQHRFNTQTFAENGYLAVAVDGNGGYLPGVSHPNSQRCETAGDVLDWLASDASGEWGRAADLSRVAIAGHSQGGSCAMGYQGDPRVDAIIAWDTSAGDVLAPTNCAAGGICQPVLSQRTDGGFATPQSHAAGYPADRDRGKAVHAEGSARGLDVMHLTMRDTVHTDWNGYGTGLAGNRLFELASNYYNVAWLDRHLEGGLVLDDAGAVVTQAGRTEAGERAYRQQQAQSAFDRLTSKRFLPGTIDRHNISMGFYDPEKAAAEGDLLLGGNVPYQVEGTWTLERLSPFYRSYCSVSVPDYVGGSNGAPGSATAARADSGADRDMRLTGCTPAPSTPDKAKKGKKARG